MVFAGCGPPPPQAPTAQADRLSDSLSMISQDCGEAFQITEFDGGPGALAPAAADARVRAHELAGVYRANPDWIYQGDTVRQIVALTVTRLRDCHLDRVARQLVRQARR